MAEYVCELPAVPRLSAWVATCVASCIRVACEAASNRSGLFLSPSHAWQRTGFCAKLGDIFSVCKSEFYPGFLPFHHARRKPYDVFTICQSVIYASTLQKKRGQKPPRQPPRRGLRARSAQAGRASVDGNPPRTPTSEKGFVLLLKYGRRNGSITGSLRP